MAMINCPECGNSISDQAAACPHCGYPIHSPKDSNPLQPVRKKDSDEDIKPISRGKILLVIILVFIIVIAISQCGKSTTRDITPAEAARTCARLYIQDEYYSGAKFDYSSESVSTSGEWHTVKGKFSLNGIVHNYSITLRLDSDVTQRTGSVQFTVNSFTLDGVNMKLRK